MKRLRTTYLALFLVLLIGCAKAPPNKPPVAPPPGTLDCAVVGQAICTFDHETNVALQSVHAFVAKFVADNNAGKFTLNASQKATLNQIVDDVNLADLTYQLWHNAGGMGPTASVKAALLKAQSDQALLSGIPGGK